MRLYYNGPAYETHIQGQLDFKPILKQESNSLLKCNFQSNRYKLTNSVNLDQIALILISTVYMCLNHLSSTVTFIGHSFIH